MEDIEYNYIRRKILALTGLDISCYKAPQMKRRLKAYLHRSGSPNWANFFRIIQTDPAALNKFREYLTINVSSFFRDADKYKYLQNSILPMLLKRRPALRVWSAGCSRGQEAYSLAILLQEIGERHYVLATDIDDGALKWARDGGPYAADEITNVPAAWLMTYFTVQKGSYWVKSSLRRRVSFQRHNLLTDPVTGRFDLIVCRNVVIYFQPAAKDKLYQLFYNVLRPGGILFVGGTEIISKAKEIGLESVKVSFYRRPE